MLPRSAALTFALPALLTGAGANADAPDGQVGFADIWNLEVAATYASWDSLGDLDPLGRGGPFETEGPGWEASIESSLTRWGSGILFGGFTVGMAGFNSDVFLEGFPDGNALDLTYAVVTLTWRLGERGNRFFDIDAGIGSYYANSLYIDCTAIPECFDAESSVNRAGGYIGASGSVWRGLKIGARVHYADFGVIGSIGPESGTLEGPMLTIQVGWEFGNW
jgi:hypothetical protein